MSNVFNFPKAPKPQRRALDMSRVKGVLGAIFGRLSASLRFVVFLALYWLRGPVHFVCNLIAGPALLACLIGLYLAHSAPKYQGMVWGCGIASFAAFAARWGYDSMLLRLAPSDQALYL